MKPKWKPHDDPKCGCAGCAIPKDPWYPGTDVEWKLFVERHGLSLTPDNVWHFREFDGTVADVIGFADMAPSGAAGYRQTVTGWGIRTGKAIEHQGDRPKTPAGQRMAFAELSGWSLHGRDPGDED